MDLAAQCIIGEDLEGRIFASLILVDENGTYQEKIDLQGELTLKVAEEFFIRFTTSNSDNTIPLKRHRPNFESDELEDKLLFDSETTFFRELQDSRGRYNAITFESKTDQSKVCITTKSATLGHFDGRFENNESFPAFLFQYSHSCDENRDEDDDEFEPPAVDEEDRNRRSLNDIENGSETQISFGNTFEAFGNQAHVFSMGKTVVDKKSRKKNQLIAARVDDGTEKYNIYELLHENETAKDNGHSHRRRFKFIYTKDESYVVAEQLFLIPMNNTKTKLRFQDPQISDEDREKALENGVDESEIDGALSRTGIKSQLGLCFRIDCYELGAGITFSNEGGVFVTARGETLANFLGHDISLEILAGFPLNSKGINKSFGQFQLDNDSSFVQFGISSKRCDNTKEFCAEFRARKEGSKKVAQFVMERQF